MERFGGGSSSDDDSSESSDDEEEEGNDAGLGPPKALVQPQSDAVTPMETEGAGAMDGAAAGGKEPSGSRLQLSAGAAGGQARRRAQAKQRRRRRAGIEVLS